jgi:hypothetical protein
MSLWGALGLGAGQEVRRDFFDRRALAPPLKRCRPGAGAGAGLRWLQASARARVPHPYEMRSDPRRSLPHGAVPAVQRAVCARASRRRGARGHAREPNPPRCSPPDRARSSGEAGTSEGGGAKQQPAKPALGLGSIWSVANAAAAAVAASASDVVRSVQETDWKNELAAFGAEVRHDAEKVTSEVGHKAQELGSRARDAVAHLPETLDRVAAPGGGGGGGGGDGGRASGSGGGGGDGGGQAAAAAGLGASISKLGLSILSSAKGVVGQARPRAILSSAGGRAKRPRPAQQPLRRPPARRRVAWTIETARGRRGGAAAAPPARGVLPQPLPLPPAAQVTEAVQGEMAPGPPSARGGGAAGMVRSASRAKYSRFEAEVRARPLCLAARPARPAPRARRGGCPSGGRGGSAPAGPAAGRLAPCSSLVQPFVANHP